MKTDFYTTVARAFAAYQNCMAAGSHQWAENWHDYIEYTVKEYAPSGSGFDAGTQFNIDASKKDKLVFETAFHHMDEAGYCIGWSEHRVIVKPSLVFGVDIRITGKNQNDIKDYICGIFYNLLDVKPRPFHEWLAKQ